MKAKYILGLLIIAILLSGCGGKETVVVKKPTAQASSQATSDQRVFPARSDCETAGFECVKEYEDGSSTGDYIKIGEVQEGEGFKLSIADADKLDQVCKTGLSPTIDAEVDGEDCTYPDDEDEYLCVSCPDGTCGEGENKCNCPQDCR